MHTRPTDEARCENNPVKFGSSVYGYLINILIMKRNFGITYFHLKVLVLSGMYRLCTYMNVYTYLHKG